MAQGFEDEVPFARPTAHPGVNALHAHHYHEYEADAGRHVEAAGSNEATTATGAGGQNALLDKRVAFALKSNPEEDPGADMLRKPSDGVEMLRKASAHTGREVMHEILTAIQLHQEHLRAQSRHLQEMTVSLERSVKKALRKTQPHRQAPATVPEESDVYTLGPETPELSSSSKQGDAWGGDLRDASNTHSRSCSPCPEAVPVANNVTEEASPMHSPFHRLETPGWSSVASIGGNKAPYTQAAAPARRSSEHSPRNDHSEAVSSVWQTHEVSAFQAPFGGTLSNIIPSIIGASRVTKRSLRTSSAASGTSPSFESHSGVSVSGPPMNHESHAEPQYYSSHWEDFPLDEGQRRQMRQAYLRMQVRLEMRSEKGQVSPVRLRNAMHRMGFNKYSLEELSWMLQSMARSVEESGWVDTYKESNKSGGISFKYFVRLLLIVDQPLCSDLFKFSRHLSEMMLTCREILVAGDINRLVAELAQVRVEDLAEPGRADGIGKWIEPIGGLVILANVIVIGVAASGEMDHTKGPAGYAWSLWLDAAFTLYFCLELLAKLKVDGWRHLAWGPDRRWNCFDLVLVVMGLLDIALSTFWKPTQEAKVISILRLIRLLRLSRLFRIFRLRQAKELVLMLKGLAAGMRTLGLAIMLLLVTIYMIAVLATTLLAEDTPDMVEGDMFGTVPIAMFTIFRCLMGDCADGLGRPLVYLYFKEYGMLLVVGYCAAMVFIVFGIFNLIFAIYIESTLMAAKAARKLDHKEHLRVAKIARELLKKFALGSHLLEQDPNNELGDLTTDGRRFSNLMRPSHTTDFDRDSSQKAGKSSIDGIAAEGGNGTFQISREVFERVLWHPSVQELLDQLEISQDRAHLFEILDADASGSVEAVELIQGLLHLRGDAKKSDMVANLLAVRASQNMIRRLEREHQEVKTIVEAMFAAWMQPGQAGPSHDSMSMTTVHSPGYHEIYHVPS